MEIGQNESNTKKKQLVLYNTGSFSHKVSHMQKSYLPWGFDSEHFILCQMNEREILSISMEKY